jgi:hypothetical protein
MKKFLILIAVLATASFAFAGGEACREKAKCNDKSAKACCADAKAGGADMAKGDVKCDLPCCKDAKADCADKADCEKTEAKDATTK